MFNMTDIPQVFGEIIGLEVEPMGILITLTIMVILTMTLALFDAPLTSIAVVNIALTAFSTFMGWFPIWITIIIALVTAVLFGRRTVEYMRGG